MTPDPTIDALRRVRHEISQEVGHDAHQLKATFAILEAQFTRPPVDYGGQRLARGVAKEPAGVLAGNEPSSGPSDRWSDSPGVPE